MQKSKRIFHASLLISAAFFLVMTISPALPNLFIGSASVCAAAFLLIFTEFDFMQVRISGIWLLLLSASIAILLCCGFSALFPAHWAYSSGMERLADIFHCDRAAFLTVLRWIFAFLSLPFLLSLSYSFLVFLRKSFLSVHLGQALHLCLTQIKPHALLKAFLSSAAGILCSVLIGTVLLTAVYLLPTDGIEANLKASAPLLAEEGEYPVLSSLCTGTLDNFTDSYILLKSAESSGSPLTDAMLTKNNSVSGLSSFFSLTSHYIDGTEFNSVHAYPRYWHGFLIFTKPLLCITDYAGIRLINTFAQILLTTVICILLWKRLSIAHSVSWLLCYLMLMPAALGKSLQFSSCFYVFSLAVLALLLYFSDQAGAAVKAEAIFLFTGIFLAYFDFLTYPIATFGIPAVVYTALNRSRVEQKLADLFRVFLFWCLGYGGMWSSKWILASILTDENVIADALHSVSVRTSGASTGGTVSYSIFGCIGQNFSLFFSSIFTVFLVLFSLILLIRMRKRFHGKIENVFPAASPLPYILLSLLPILWYSFTVNHSTIHSFFTNKACAVSALAVLFGLSDLYCSSVRGIFIASPED